MKEVDPFFGTMFQRDSVAGSFWDGLKIGKPVEFDKNFVLKLPSCLANKIEVCFTFVFSLKKNFFKSIQDTYLMFSFNSLYQPHPPLLL